MIIEAEVMAEAKAKYLDLAARLRPHLTGRDGFLSSERFQSLTSPGKVLSLSFWRDEAAVAARRHPGLEGAEVEVHIRPPVLHWVRLPWRRTVDQLHQRRNCRNLLRKRPV